MGKRTKKDESVSRCVSCGKPMEYNKETHLVSHHCSEGHIARREGASTRGEEPIVRERPYSERIAEGFTMMRACGNSPFTGSDNDSGRWFKRWEDWERKWEKA